jgi:aldose 1-epimerase
MTSAMSISPSGEQIELSFGDHRVVIVEVGGGLREYTYADRPVLDGYREDEMCSAGRGQMLIPWPNRLRDGRYEWQDRTLQLALTEPDKHNAIHGLVRWSNWVPAEREGHRVVMRHVVHPQTGYPFALSLELEYSLAEHGLTVETRAVNVGAGACPFGAGAHPYLTVGTQTVDECVLQAPGATWMDTDERQIPTATGPVDGTEFDFRTARPIGSLQIDTGYGQLARDGDGLARVTLEAPGGGPRATLWMDEAYPYLMLFTGDTVPVDRRRQGLGVEPMTCAPNAFQSGDGLRTLEPGERFIGRWGIEPV